MNTFTLYSLNLPDVCIASLNAIYGRLYRREIGHLRIWFLMSNEIRTRKQISINGPI